MNRVFEGFSNFHLTFDKLCFLHLICLKLSPKLPQNSPSPQMVFPSHSLKLSTFLPQESMPKATHSGPLQKQLCSSGTNFSSCLLSVVVINTTTKRNLGKKGLIWFTGYNLSSREAKMSTQDRN